MVYVHEPQKQVRVHHARPTDRGIGHVLGEETPTKGQDTGQFFQYVSLCAGQTFAGTWRGKARDILVLLDCLEKQGNVLQLGRSRTVEYGQVTLTPYPGAAMSAWGKGSQIAPGFLTLWLLTPLVLADGDGRETQDPKVLIQEINTQLDCEIVLRKSFLTFTELSGYHSKWRFPKPQRRVLAPGSALLVETKKPLVLEAITRRQWGLDTGAGYGCIEGMVHDSLGDKTRERVLQRKSVQYIKWDKMVNNSGLENDFLTYLQKSQEKRREQNQERINGLLTDVPGQWAATKIHQIIELFATGQTYEFVEKELKKISNREKREEYLRFIAPCAGKSPAFIKAYLQNAKWKARSEHDGDTSPQG